MRLIDYPLPFRGCGKSCVGSDSALAISRPITRLRRIVCGRQHRGQFVLHVEIKSDGYRSDVRSHRAAELTQSNSECNILEAVKVQAISVTVGLIGLRRIIHEAAAGGTHGMKVSSEFGSLWNL